MIKRTLSTIILWSVVFGTVYFFGFRGAVVLLVVLSALAQYEFHGLLEKSGLPPWRMASLAFGTALLLDAGLYNNEFTLYLWLFFVVGIVAGALVDVHNPLSINRLAGSVLAIVYIPILLLAYVAVTDQYNLSVTIWVIAAAKFTDVGGFLVGSRIGRHKLAPSISPGKTWEGVAGGLALSSLVSALAAHFAHNWFPLFLTPGVAAVLALPIGIASIVSDLSESAFKRRAGVKDSGNCIPGIGGALDLVDSLLLAGWVALYVLQLSEGFLSSH